jgi:putative ABC transport system permease protein
MLRVRPLAWDEAPLRGAPMRPGGILYLYRMRLRARFIQEAFAVIGIAAGVALLFASQVASTSLNGSVRQLTSGLVGGSQLQLTARGPNGFEERLLGKVRQIPGVRSSAPLLELQANVIGPAGSAPVNLVGADPRFVRLGGRLLRHFSAAALAHQHAVALPAPLGRQIGAGSLQIVKLQVGASTIPALVGVTLQKNDIGALVDSPVVLAPLGYAQQLAGMTGRITRIFVQAQRGHESEVRASLVRLAAGHLNVEPADFDAVLFENAAAATNQSTALFAAISALVGFLFAGSAMLLTVPARRRLIADLRLDGYGHWAITQVLLFDALVLGAISSLLGLALGEELSLRLFHTSPGYLSFAFAVGSERIVTWQSIALAFAGGMFVACAGVLAPLRDVVWDRSRATGGHRQQNRGWGQAAVPAGVACLAVTTAVIVLAPQAAVFGVVSLTAALLLLLPRLIRVLLAVIERLTVDVKARAPFVALAELRSEWARTVGIAATGAVAVFGSVAIQGAHADLQRGLDQSASDISSPADVWAFAPGLNNLLATTPFRASALSTIAHLPGVQAVRVYRGGFLDYKDRRVWVSAPPRADSELVPPHQLQKGDLALANARLREGGWAVISQALAKEHHLHIGQAFALPAPHPTSFRVAALSTNIGWPPGAIVINAEDYARAWESDQASAYEITAAPGVPLATVREEVAHALGPASGLSVQTSLQREQHQRAASRQGLSRLSQISDAVLIAAVLAMAAAMANMIWQRRGPLLRLKLDGFTDLVVWRTLVLESVLVVGSGCLIGAVFGLYGQLLASHSILIVTGFPVVFSVRVLVALISLALTSLVAIAITAVPGYFIARMRPAASLSE